MIDPQIHSDHSSYERHCLEGIQKGRDTVENRQLQNEHTITLQFNYGVSWWLPELAKKVYPHKGLQTAVYSGLTHH